MENLKLETEIQQELNCMTLRSLASVDLTVPSVNQKNAVQEFFLLMAICNTVVVSLHAHEDPVCTVALLTDIFLRIIKIHVHIYSKNENTYFIKVVCRNF